MWPDLSAPEYRKAVDRVIKRGVLSPGVEVEMLEREFEEHLLGASGDAPQPHCVAVSSGTAALEALLRLYEIGPGHEVIVPALTFTATALPVLAVGATPVFADVDETWGIDPGSVARMITARTQAILAVDLHGNPASWDALRSLAAHRGLLLLEDACPAYGAVYGSTACGLLGPDGAAFSFNSGKMCPAGEGGMVVLPDRPKAERVRRLAFFGEDRTANGAFRLSGGYGTNWKMPELTAAVARVSLTRLDDVVKRGWLNGMVLREALPDGFEFPYAYPAALPSWHKLRIWNRSGRPRRDVEDRLEALGVPVTRRDVHALPQHPVFRRFPADEYPGAIAALRDTVVLGTPTVPVFGITEEEAALWAAGVNESMRRVR